MLDTDIKSLYEAELIASGGSSQGGGGGQRIPMFQTGYSDTAL